jgi:hypothetical protein
LIYTFLKTNFSHSEFSPMTNKKLKNIREIGIEEAFPNK